MEARTIPTIDCGRLWLVGVVYYAELTVFNVGVNFHVVVATEPAVELIFTVATPQHCSVQQTVVLKAVGQATDVHTSTRTILVYSQLNFFFSLHKNGGFW